MHFSLQYICLQNRVFTIIQTYLAIQRVQNPQPINGIVSLFTISKIHFMIFNLTWTFIYIYIYTSFLHRFHRSCFIRHLVECLWILCLVSLCIMITDHILIPRMIILMITSISGSIDANFLALTFNDISHPHFNLTDTWFLSSLPT